MLTIGRWGLFVALLAVAVGCAGHPPQPATEAGKQTQAGPLPPPATSTEATKPSAAPAEEAAAMQTGKIEWNYDYADGLKKAKEADKPVMVDVFATWCAPCKHLDETVFSRADVAEASKAFVTVRIDGDKHPDLVRQLRVDAYPTVLFLTPEGKEIGRSLGAVAYQDMLDSMASAKQEYKG